MSGAEALAVIGIIANVLALVDFSREVLERAGDFGGKVKDVPKAFQDLKIILPLIGETLKKTKARVDAGELDEPTCKAIKPVLQGCGTKLKDLKAIFEKVIPREDASRFTVFFKAVWSTTYDKDVEAIAKTIRDYIATLTYYHAEAAGLSKAEKDAIISSMAKLAMGGSVAQDNSQTHPFQLPSRTNTGLSNQGKPSADDRKAVLDWLSTMNNATVQQNCRSKWQRGTGDWILETKEYRSWIQGSHRRLWCRGQQGAGKTILASVIIQSLREQASPETGLAYIYCSYKSPEQNKALNLVGSLVRQLVEKSNEIPSTITASYRTHNEENTLPILEELSTMMQSQLRRYERVNVVIDALDECDEDNRALLMATLSDIQDVSPGLHILTTSRKIDIIGYDLKDAVPLEISARDDDIRKYLQSKLAVRLRSLTRSNKALQKTIEDTLISKAQGMFLLAELHFELLADKAKRGTVASIVALLKDLPPVLNDTYTALWQRVLNQENENDVAIARSVLTWISYALEPLSIDSIRHGIATETPGLSQITEEELINEELPVAVCLGLVVLDEDGRALRFVHYTAQEFFPAFLKDYIPRPNREIARACISYLSLSVFNDKACQNSIEIETMLENYSLLDYAARKWGVHARGDPELPLQSSILEFLANQQNLSCATRVMLHLGTTDSSYDVLYDPPMFVTDVDQVAMAAFFGLESILLNLLTSGKLASKVDNNGWTPLHWASYGGHIECVRMLIQHHASPDVKDRRGCPMLIWAIGTPPIATFTYTKFDISGNAAVQLGDLIVLDEKSGSYAPNYFSFKRAQTSIIELLINASCDINSINETGLTALSSAAMSHSFDIISLLIKHGADIDAEDDYGMTALLWALQFPRVSKEYSRISISGNAKVHIGDYIILQPKSQLKVSRNPPSVNEAAIATLIGTKLAHRDHYGRTALGLAAENRYITTVENLIKAGANVVEVDKDGFTALDRALHPPRFRRIRCSRVAISGDPQAQIGIRLEFHGDPEKLLKPENHPESDAQPSVNDRIVSALRDAGAGLEIVDGNSSPNDENQSENQSGLHEVKITRNSVSGTSIALMGFNFSDVPEHISSLIWATIGGLDSVVKYSRNTVSGNASVLFGNDLAVTYDENEKMPDTNLEYLRSRFRKDDNGRFYVTAPYIGHIGGELAKNPFRHENSSKDCSKED